MNPGDVVLIRLAQVAGGSSKLRPALLLAALPGPYQSLLVCGVSTQLARQQSNWDERIQPGDSDYTGSGLHQASIIRLSYLHAADPREITGVIGRIDAPRLDRLLIRLSDHLRP